jgi:hypothetical protein
MNSEDKKAGKAVAERRLNAQTAGNIMQIIAHSLAPFLSEF